MAISFATFAKEEEVQKSDKELIQESYERFLSSLTKEKIDTGKCKFVIENKDKEYRRIIKQFIIDTEDSITLEKALNKVLSIESLYVKNLENVKQDSDSIYKAKFEIYVKGYFKGENNDTIQSSVKYNVTLNWEEIRFWNNAIKSDRTTITADVNKIKYTTEELNQNKSNAIAAIEKWYADVENNVKAELEGGKVANISNSQISIKEENEVYKSTNVKVITVSKPLDYSTLANPEEYELNQNITFEITPSFIIKNGEILEVKYTKGRYSKPQTIAAVIERKQNAAKLSECFKNAIETNDTEKLSELFADIKLKDGIQVSYLRGNKEDIKNRMAETYLKNVNLDKISIEASPIEYKDGNYTCEFMQIFSGKSYSDLTKKIIVFSFDEETNNCLIEKIKVIEGSTIKID